MSTARSVFTEAIEEHLSLKKQNVRLEAVMPLARYDVGDPLDRYPGGPPRGVESGTIAVQEPGPNLDAPTNGAGPGVPATAATPTPSVPDTSQDTQLLVGPSPEQAMEAATALESVFADRPFAPLSGGMTPLLSLVEDIDEDDAAPGAVRSGLPTEPPAADVLSFPGGVGTREGAVLAVDSGNVDSPSGAMVAAKDAATATSHEGPTGEQRVIIVDTSEPLAGASDYSEPPAASRSNARKKPRFFGLGRKNKQQDAAADGWFTDGPRDFDWD